MMHAEFITGGVEIIAFFVVKDLCTGTVQCVHLFLRGSLQTIGRSFPGIFKGGGSGFSSA